ncbi:MULTISPECIES: DUF4926 domain-containing protein [unclassified Microcystis]|uniref:DUF4926 domain-containing protein n=1 Tax=Microcystis flos-aquae Mf_QC_C_20070823_S10D TaxID=2486236 RepID=A0A552L8K0_9CHRO|nr:MULTISPECIES: DUF4926 domain-containing protein [unclassified Microcystis]MCA2818846.1 DUF4926 domain-containing protein [Microcystis sp. M085S1]MCA2856411.1 DUF4926 domain-containing protein [Microcystis sp. M065S1]TRT79835.1 MAG: DUF4926 domain-containing protein [Microcystis flos-aquae Ma_QC_C_20070823_S18]TRT92805.1 MAG: DUF4926 domain-containing protein [Microcystis flos-aquae Ma_QC_C_20070823_S18D]TRV16542.1 MAG: DUF4926 domain-containing protein [Microcystis flos-aquae Mf_QC_C_200708
MSKFQLFDGVILREYLPLIDGGIAPIGTIVEILKNGEAYLVELFGDWVKYDEQGNFVCATQTEKGAFLETIGVEIVYPHQLVLTFSAKQTMTLT